MKSVTSSSDSPSHQAPISFSPELLPEDTLAIHWIRQVTSRLRREVSWSLHDYRSVPGSGGTPSNNLVGQAAESLGLNRYLEEKKRFFRTDPTAAYLSQQIEATPPPGENDPVRGSFFWVQKVLSLDDTGCFVLALGLTSAFDSAMGSVVSVCLNNLSKTRPNLALAQKLWNRPEEILQIADPSHPVFRYGLVHHAGITPYHSSAYDWDGPIRVPSIVAHNLLFPEAPLPPGLEPLSNAESGSWEENAVFIESSHLIASRIHASSESGLRIVPILGPKGSGHEEIVRGLSQLMNRQVVTFRGDPSLLNDAQYRNSLSTLCWLRGIDLFLGPELSASIFSGDHQDGSASLPLGSIPVTIFLSITDKKQLSRIPDHQLLPIIRIPASSYKERIARWKLGLDEKAESLSGAIAESARRFRYEKETIDRIANGLRLLPRKITEADLTTACRSEFDLDIGELAQKVTPRFSDEQLILPSRQRRQFKEIGTAIQALTRVHYDWGTAEAWNESGISVLFAGPPGTGKTMAAEILAKQLDIPMYRIDLSQVVNKYIGETEKNLKMLFDTADISDIILFFDEADALFGKRTEVKDSHDRYANLEISYLLERMERFKGVCILATNRKKDLDEAFLRRLRYIVDFPAPGEGERKRIWEQVIPGTVDRSEIDINFLARQFPLVGGHIRSIVFNACLQSSDHTVASTGPGDEFRGKLRMEDVAIAVKREYDKLNRSVSLEHFGPYADLVRKMEQT